MIKVTSFYKFFAIPSSNLEEIKQSLQIKGEELELRGLILIAKEGLNATLSGSVQNLEDYKKYIENLLEQSFFYKDSECETWNFKRFSIKIKKEIINIGSQYPDLEEFNKHLTPKEWEQKIKNKQDTQVLDIRNNYEIEVGKFKNAQDLNLSNFQEFSKKLEDSLQNKKDLDKKKETLIYCTGGIRCEKALEIMKEKGFDNVYQLEGGIINYLKEFPHSQFDEECFVFDHRVALDQHLKTSSAYKLCPHCGQPAQQEISCHHCKKQAIVCTKCLKNEKYYHTCSKNCAYHFKEGHKNKKSKQDFASSSSKNQD